MFELDDHVETKEGRMAKVLDVFKDESGEVMLKVLVTDNPFGINEHWAARHVRKVEVEDDISGIHTITDRNTLVD